MNFGWNYIVDIAIVLLCVCEVIKIIKLKSQKEAKKRQKMEEIKYWKREAEYARELIRQNLWDDDKELLKLQRRLKVCKVRFDTEVDAYGRLYVKNYVPSASSNHVCNSNFVREEQDNHQQQEQMHQTNEQQLLAAQMLFEHDRQLYEQQHQQMLEQQEQMHQLDDFTTRSGWDAMNASNEAMHACDHNMNFPQF